MDIRVEKLIPRVLNALEFGPNNRFGLYMMLNLDASYLLDETLDILEKEGKIKGSDDSWELVKELPAT